MRELADKEKESTIQKLFARFIYVSDPLLEFQCLAMCAIMWVGTVFGNGQDILGKSVNPCVWVRGDGILNIANECSAAQIEPMRLLSPDYKVTK